MWYGTFLIWQTFQFQFFYIENIFYRNIFLFLFISNNYMRLFNCLWNKTFIKLTMMNNRSLNIGCILIASAPVIAVHFLFIKHYFLILYSWLSSFVCTILLLICSLSTLFTKKGYFILLFTVPIECAGKILIRYLTLKKYPIKDTLSQKSFLGLACGMGYAFAHFCILFLPYVVEEKYSIKFDENHPKYFPISLDLALMNTAMSLIHITTGILMFKFDKVNELLTYLWLVVVHYATGLISLINIIALKLILIYVIAIVGFVVSSLIANRRLCQDLIKIN